MRISIIKKMEQVYNICASRLWSEQHHWNVPLQSDWLATILPSALT